MPTSSGSQVERDRALDAKTMKCIRCGFCLDACPTFRLTGMETRGPRGRIYLVRSWREGAVSMDSDVVSALDTCLGCRACETACPSGVEYGSILEIARARIEETRARPAMQSLSRRLLLAVLTDPRKLRYALKVGRLLARGGGASAPSFLANLWTGTRGARVTLPLPQDSATVSPLPERYPPVGAKRATVGILTGCVMRTVFAGTNAATVRVLQANGCEVVAPPAAGCCGALHLHTGFRTGALERARSLIDSFEPHMAEIDAIVVNSAGCGSTMKEYADLLADDVAYSARAAAFARKVRDVAEFLSDLGVEPPTGRMDKTVTYHDACHLAHAQNVRQQPRALLTSIPGLKLVELEEADTCCGSAGIYNLTEPDLAGRLLDRKVANVAATGAEIVATGNPGCIAWIREGARARGIDVRVCHPIDLLDEAYGKPA